ncbi:PqqD family protein [bacterium]|nr:PqqD family protein [bacterium]
MTITSTSIFIPNPACPVREIGEGLVIMAPAGDMTHSLEDIGAFVWSHLDGQHDLEALADAVTAAYDVDRATAESDLKAFLADLLASGLVQAVD